MGRTILEVNNVSKQYRLGEIGTGTLSHDLNRWWHRVRGKGDPYALVGTENDRTKKTDDKYVWALKDLDFKVAQGDVLGIIGKNGAGKSTVLKILSEITSPTTGNIKVKGRVASLLEVGTGMHPELTGRENIYLNGAILGMRKHEIVRKFDEIVDFSGCGKYIDTPVKRYSSGMMVRLGFAVAAFLEPEILIVDEVLAVGDLEFQSKAIGKMKDVSETEGRTVLFVSHNMMAIQNLCKTGILLENGQITYRGSAKDVVSHYKDVHYDKFAGVALSERTDIYNQGVVKINGIYLTNSNGEKRTSFSCGEELNINLEYESERPELEFMSIALGLYDSYGSQIGDIWNFASQGVKETYPGKAHVKVKIPRIPLNEGKYYFNVNFAERNKTIYAAQNAIYFDILQDDFFGSGFLPDPKAAKFLMENHWEIESK